MNTFKPHLSFEVIFLLKIIQFTLQSHRQPTCVPSVCSSSNISWTEKQFPSGFIHPCLLWWLLRKYNKHMSVSPVCDICVQVVFSMLSSWSLRADTTSITSVKDLRGQRTTLGETGDPLELERDWKLWRDKQRDKSTSLDRDGRTLYCCKRSRD